MQINNISSKEKTFEYTKIPVLVKIGPHSIDSKLDNFHIPSN